MNRDEISRMAYTLISIPVTYYVLHELGLNPVRSGVDSAEATPSGCQVTLYPHFSELHYRKTDKCTKDGATDGTWVKFSLQKEGESIPFKLHWPDPEGEDTEYTCAITAKSDIDSASRYTYHLVSKDDVPIFLEACDGSCNGLISISWADTSFAGFTETIEMVQRQRGDEKPQESETDGASEVVNTDDLEGGEEEHDEL